MEPSTRAPRPRRLSAAIVRRLQQSPGDERADDPETDLGVVHFAIQRANAIFGHGRWGAFVTGPVAFHPTPGAGRGRGFYTASVRLEVDGALSRTETGAGITSDASPESHAAAYVAAIDDALRRALAHFGPQLTVPAMTTDADPDQASLFRGRVLAAAAAAGCDEARLRAWAVEHYGADLEALTPAQLADAASVLERGLQQRVAERAA